MRLCALCLHRENPAECAFIQCDAPEAATKRNIRLFARFLVILLAFSLLYFYGQRRTENHHISAGLGTVIDGLWDSPYGANKPTPATAQRLAKMYREDR